jgi:predicted nucleic acid-binding protein
MARNWLHSSEGDQRSSFLPGILRLCRDPDDDIVFETAVIGRADFVVSRDDGVKGAPEVAAFVSQFRIPVLAVRQLLVEIAPSA